MRSKKYSFVGLLLVSGLVVSGCTTTTPDQVLTLSDPNQPLGQPKRTGDFGNVRKAPQPATAQLTTSEVAAAKAELTSDVAPSTAQAKQSNEATYRREVSELQKLAQDQKARRLKEIESRKF